MFRESLANYNKLFIRLSLSLQDNHNTRKKDKSAQTESSLLNEKKDTNLELKDVYYPFNSVT